LTSRIQRNRGKQRRNKPCVAVKLGELNHYCLNQNAIHLRVKYKQSLLRLVSNYQLNAQFLYSTTVYMLHYNPRHVSSSTVLIFRRANCITESDDTRCCNNTICPPEDEHSTARNMSRIIM